MKKRDSKKKFIVRIATAMTLIIFFCLTFFFLPPVVFSTVIFFIFGVIVFFEWPRLFKKTDFLGWLLLPIYPTISLLFVILLNQCAQNRMLIVVMIILATTFDTGSYLFGSLFGKHKIAPRISPRKSWEGAIGGYLLVCISLTIIFWKQGTQILLGHFILLTLSICTLALTGDFFESWLKRRAGIKDSGDFLPGHGGFLDRFDSMLFLLPFFYLFKNYLAQLFGLIF